MPDEILVLAAVLAVAAAVRSTWSPCGISMLSSMTPLSERARGHRYAVTVAWFVLGAVLGGLTLGAGAAAGAIAFGWIDLSPTLALGAVAAVALACGAMDAGVVGPPLPHNRRQVNELWFGRYRRWAYASGFGWQIGTGLATYIMTAAVYATVTVAALGANPAAALSVCVLFGALRGLAVLAGWRLTAPERLLAFHRRFDALGSPVRWAVVATQLVVATVAAGLAWGPWALAAVAAAIVIGALTHRAISPRAPSSEAADLPAPYGGQAISMDESTPLTSRTSTARAR